MSVESLSEEEYPGFPSVLEEQNPAALALYARHIDPTVT
jgi:hypothetical protein